MADGSRLLLVPAQEQDICPAQMSGHLCMGLCIRLPSHERTVYLSRSILSGYGHGHGRSLLRLGVQAEERVVLQRKCSAGRQGGCLCS